MPPEAGAVCVNCRKRPVAAEWRPFCSERCKLLDLARWADGGFRIAGESEHADPEADEPPPDSGSRPDR